MSEKNKILLGLDWGERRIGVALGNTENRLASPLTTVHDLEQLKRLILSEDPDLVVIGDPRRLDGSKQRHPGFAKFCDFVEKLRPVVLLDERLSSKAADALPGSTKTKAGRDEIAAMLTLQGYLDSL